MSTPEVFIVSAARTAIGSFGGSLKDVALSQLATFWSGLRSERVYRLEAPGWVRANRVVAGRVTG